MNSTAARKWIPFAFSRRHHQRQRRRDPEGEGQSNSVEGQLQEHNDLEMTLKWLVTLRFPNDFEMTFK